MFTAISTAFLWVTASVRLASMRLIYLFLNTSSNVETVSWDAAASPNESVLTVIFINFVIRLNLKSYIT